MMMVMMMMMLMTMMTMTMTMTMTTMMTNPAASIPVLATIMADAGEWKRSTTNPVIVIIMMMTIMMTTMMLIRRIIHFIVGCKKIGLFVKMLDRNQYDEGLLGGWEA